MEKELNIEYEIKPKGKINLGLKELWQHRELLYFFSWRDIKVKYKQTVLGFLWAILQPLIMMLIFTLFFGKGLKMPSENLPYSLFVLSGLIFWNVFSTGITNSGNSMVTNANMIKKIYFPRLIIPISAVLVSVFDFIFSYIIFVMMVIYYQIQYGYQFNYLFIFAGTICSLVLTCMASFGSGVLLAALNVKYRDFRYVIPFFVQALLFVTPVIYPLSIIGSSWLKFILALNPMYAPIELIRMSLTGHIGNTYLLAMSMISSFVVLLIGIYYFRKTEYQFADLA